MVAVQFQTDTAMVGAECLCYMMLEYSLLIRLPLIFVIQKS
jgi:hypothetical protein